MGRRVVTEYEAVEDNRPKQGTTVKIGIVHVDQQVFSEQPRNCKE